MTPDARNVGVVALGIAVVIGAFALWYSGSETAITSFAPEIGADAAGVADPMASEGTSIATPAATPAETTPTPRESLATPNPAAGMRITVTDRDGEPIEGATLRAVEPVVNPVSATDSQGTCVLPLEPSDDSVRLHIDAAGFHHCRGSWSRRSELTIRLYRVTTLVGTVRDAASGTPIPGTRLLRHHSYCKGCEADDVTADESGRFELAGVPIGQQFAIATRAERYPRQSHEITLTLAGPSTEHDVFLARGIEITVAVTDLTTGAPLAGAALSDGTDGYHGGPLARTDASGQASGLFLPRGRKRECWVELEAEGYCRMRRAITAIELTHPLPVRMPRGAIVTGTVRDPDGRAVAGASIVLGDNRRRAHEHRQEHADPPASPLEELAPWVVEQAVDHEAMRSNDAGAFRLVGAVPWSHFKFVAASHDDYRRTSTTLERLGAPGETVDVALTMEPIGPTAVVTGHLTVNGEPCAGSVRWRGATRQGSCQASASGAFRLDDVETGAVELTARPDDFDAKIEWGVASKAELTLRPDENRTCDFALETPMATIAGRVLRVDGQPIENASIGARQNDGRHHARTDAAGAYRVSVPDRGRYDLHTRYAGIGVHVSDVAPGASGVDFEVPLSGQLRYRVIDAADRQPVERFDLSFATVDGKFGSGTSSWHSQSDDDGWRVQAVPAGQLRLTIRTFANYRPVTVERHVAGGETPTDVTFELVEGERLRLRLPNGTAPWPTPSIVMLIREDLWDHVQVTTNEKSQVAGATGYNLGRHVSLEDGVALLDRLEPARYRFKVFGANFAIEPEYIDVMAGDTRQFEIRWREIQPR